MEIFGQISVIDLTAQISGVFAAASGMTWAMFRSRTGMLATQAAAGFFFAIHYFLIGATTAAAMNILAGAQAGAAIPLGENPRFRVVYVALLPLIAIGVVLTWSGGPSAAAAAATVLISLARYQTAVIPFRWFMAAALPCWFIHNIWVFSVPGMLSDVCGMTVNAAMLWRALREKAAATASETDKADEIRASLLP